VEGLRRRPGPPQLSLLLAPDSHLDSTQT
jgi:hypothetical protein